MSVPQQPQQQQVILQQAAEPSLMSKCACAAKKADAVTMGAMMGSLVGLTIGFIGGGFQILRAGPGPRGALATLSQYMLSSGATFGFFMSIGSVIRTESALHDEARWRAAFRAHGDRVAMARRMRV